MQMNYYNSRLALWEPFIEPVEVESSMGYKHKPWLLELKVKSIEIWKITTNNANEINILVGDIWLVPKSPRRSFSKEAYNENFFDIICMLFKIK